MLRSEKMRVPLANGKYLVAEAYPEVDYGEIYIYLENENGVIVQDLAAVKEAYHIDHGEVVYDQDKYVAVVYADEQLEDYTDRFVIEEYKGDENE